MKDIDIIHCLFEQSGVFKNAFRAAGYNAYDYDINNEYQQTDTIIDLFSHIEKAYQYKESLFQTFSKKDLIIAFFPCIYFAGVNQMYFNGTTVNFAHKTELETVNAIIQRSQQRQKYYELLLKLCAVCLRYNYRLIIENPFSYNSYLYNNFPFSPAFIDFDRTIRGDKFKKPTQYFFINCVPSRLQTVEKKYKTKKIYSLSGAHIGGICNKLRSEITPEYALNFINDIILGNITEKTEKTLFDI